MTIENFLQAVFQVSIAVSFTALCISGVAVSVYYSWKTADRIIKGKLIEKLEDSPFFRRSNNDQG